MSDSGSNRSGGTVLQRLLAENYKHNEVTTSTCSRVLDALCPTTPVTPAVTVGMTDNQCTYDPETNESDLAARLDALCRPAVQRSVGDEENKIIISHNTSQPSRPPPPSYAEAQIEITHTSHNETPACNFNTNVPQILSPRFHKSPSPCASNDNRQQKLVMPKRSPECKKTADTAKGRMRLNGHPKSSSGGDEYLYTDSLRSSDKSRKVQLRGIRGRKNSPVARSSSLHQSPEDKPSLPHYHRVSLEEQRFSRLSGEQLNSGNLTFNTNLETKHPASLANNTNSSRKEQRRYSAHSNPFQAQNPRSSDEANLMVQTPTFSQVSPNLSSDSACSDVNTNGVSSIMPQTPTANQSSSFLRNSAAPNVHGHYFQPVGMMGQSQPTTPTHAHMMNNQSPQRRPPPPYPAGMMGLEQVSAQQDDVNAWQPQRPNSLALGQSSKKKGSFGSALNSPTVTSPTSVQNMFPGTPRRGTPLYNGNKESPYTGTPGFQPLYQTAANSTPNLPHQRQASNGNGCGQHLTRTNSGRNVLMQGASSSSSSSTATAVSTPNYQEMPNFPEVSHRSPMQANTNTYNMQNTPVSNYPQDGFVQVTNGVGVSKSDSMNSGTSTTSSGASRIARRRKRNSSSKGNYPANSSGSGSSSSNSGSRPNSNADLTDRLVWENENLSNQLQAYQMKLKKFETIQAELQRITEDHHALHLSANKRESLENELRNKLTARVKQLEQEKQSLENRVVAMTDNLKTTSISSKDEEAKEKDVSQLINAQNRKFAEKERQLQEELEECRDRLSEQNVEIELLASSLSKAEATITCFKEKFLQSTEVDICTEQLSERLGELQRIVEERQEVESELRDRHKRQMLQRPLRSTSSNDEGISEMDAADASSSGFSDLFNNRESRMLGVKAEMLKWQHMYLEQGLLQDVQASSSASRGSSNRSKIYKALRNHRHTISDPGFDKINISQYPLPSSLDAHTSQRKLHAGVKTKPTRNNSALELSIASQTNVTSQHETANRHSERIDCACQTPDGDWTLDKPNPASSQCEHTNFVRDANSGYTVRSSAGRSGATRNSMIETEPSEGYHSQQSSGSPTPNTEKSSVHFPTPSDYSGSASCTPLRETLTSDENIRRNRSSDILPSLNV